MPHTIHGADQQQQNGAKTYDVKITLTTGEEWYGTNSENAFATWLHDVLIDAGIFEDYMIRRNYTITVAERPPAMNTPNLPH